MDLAKAPRVKLFRLPLFTGFVGLYGDTATGNITL